MHWEDALAGGVLGFIGSVPVAGPVALVIMMRGLRGEWSAARGVAIGAGLAEGVLAGLVFGGLGIALAGWPALRAVLDWVGLAVLFGLGAWFAWRGSGRPVEAKRGGEGQGVNGGSSLLLGLGMVLGNPGLLGTWSAAVAALEGTGWVAADAKGAAWFGGGVAIGVTSWFWVLLVALRRWGSSVNGRILDLGVRGIGGVLLLMGAFAAARMWRGL